MEKTIVLEQVDLVDFLGVDNAHLAAVVAAFPTCKITAEGNEIRLQGSKAVVEQVEQLFTLLLGHYHQHHHLSMAALQHYLQPSGNALPLAQLGEVILHGYRGMAIKPKTPHQRKLVQAIDQHPITFAIGPAGTGKTFLAVAMAVRALKAKRVRKLIITRPVVESGERLGFLPGDVQEKVDPYMRPIYDALEMLLSPEKLRHYQDNQVIEVAPLAYMRGRTLQDAFVILDEAQNTTPMQLKMFLTRMGTSSTVVVNGDITQLDLPPHTPSGLIDALKVLREVREIAFVHFTQQDVVRHPLVSAIIQAYDRTCAKPRKDV